MEKIELLKHARQVLGIANVYYVGHIMDFNSPPPSLNSDILPRRSNGIILRRLAPSDLAAFQAYRTDEALGRYQGWTATSDSEAASFLLEMSTVPLLQPGEWSQIGIAREADETLIGDIGLYLAPDGMAAEIGFTLNRQSQGQGIATIAVGEAIHLVFEHTAVNQVIAITDARNIPSIRLLERVGMTRTKSASAIFRGEPCLEFTYALNHQNPV
ncbi:MAG: GNAT family N-acetyltransferase [Chloroflexota bacterium]